MDDPLQLARSSGPGAGHFLHRSLEDSLEHRRLLAEVRHSRDLRSPLVEFVFSGNAGGRGEPADGHAGTALEVIRCRLGSSGEPEHVVIWLRPNGGAGLTQHPDAARLKHWLRGSERVAGIMVNGERLRLLNETDEIEIQCRARDAPFGAHRDA